jgi:hypothetical protein
MSAEMLPLDQVRPGMRGYAYTIFAGDLVEKFDLEVIGVMPNFLGPKQAIILVQLEGAKVEHTGVVAGMSGSPVYLDGKLVGALSLKLGVFTKEPIAGVTPIADVLAGGGVGAGNSGAQTQEVGSNRDSPGVVGAIGRGDRCKGGAELRSIETLAGIFRISAGSHTRNFRINWMDSDLWRHRAEPLRRGRMTETLLRETWPEWCWYKETFRSTRHAQ